MPFLCSPVLPIDPTIEAKAVAVLWIVIAALAQFGRIQVAIMRCVKLSLVHFTTSFTQLGQRRRFTPRQRRNLLPAVVPYVFPQRQHLQVVVYPGISEPYFLAFFSASKHSAARSMLCDPHSYDMEIYGVGQGSSLMARIASAHVSALP